MLIHDNPHHLPKTLNRHQGQWDCKTCPLRARMWQRESLICAPTHRFLSAFRESAESSSINKNLLTHILLLVSIPNVYRVRSRLTANAFSLLLPPLARLCFPRLPSNILFAEEIYQQFLKIAKRLFQELFCWKTSLLNIKQMYMKILKAVH